MSGFNTSSARKEDLSVKLRAQNMKNAKDTTRQLEQENRKMEERLRELKMAMNREKEERERQGGGFWQRGHQEGTLNNYATQVLNDKTSKSGKKKGVKVLKDEPLDVPKRSSGPGTMKHIAQQNPHIDHPRDAKNKGPKCGQCEDRVASLTCVQCSENYCAGCFAAFHLKGALKRHRSIPLHATGPRQCMSPRPTPPASSRSSVSGGASSGDVFYQQADRYSLGGASGSKENSSPAGTGSNSLLEGAYNETDSAASFQQALLAWRQGETTADTKSKPRQTVVASPVKSPVTTMEHSTSTTTDRNNQPIMPDIKSAPHSLSYAQRLMLKQHRRTDVGHLGTPRLGSADTSVMGSSGLTSVTPRLSSVGRGGGMGSDDDDDEDFDEDDRVDFQSLYEAVSNSSEQGSNRVTVANIRVVDVTDSPKEQRSASAESSTYTVQEVSEPLTSQTPNQTRLPESQEATSSSQSKRLSKSRETTRVIEKQSRVSKSREVTRVLDRSSIAESEDFDGASLNTNHSHKPHAKENTQVISSKLPQPELPTLEESEMPSTKKKPPAAASGARPKSSKSRPASSRAMNPRSRPSSRTQSRAASRMEVEGVLTKAPSSSLSEIARRTTDSGTLYQSPMEGFFMAGVKVDDQVEGSKLRPVTPAKATGSKSRPVTPGLTEKLKISNKLYAMSPRSWRPDSSLGEAVGASGEGFNPSAVPETASPLMRYTYSGQLAGQPLAWNPQDSLGTPVPPEEDEAPTPTPADRTATPTTPTPASRQRKHRGETPDPSDRPFSAQRPEATPRKEGKGDKSLRPSSSTGGAEPSKRQRRKLPSIDNDLDTDKRARAMKQKSNPDGWIGDEDQQDPAIRALSASRTRSWVASQNSLRPDSSQWETTVEDFVVGDSCDLGEEVTPRAQSRLRSGKSTARSSLSRNSNVEESGRLSRNIVMDGEDLSRYDTDVQLERGEQNSDDKEALNQLEWELASESGRITAEGKISRLSTQEVDEDAGSTGSRSSSSTVRLSYDQGYDINTKLKGDELSEDENDERVRSRMDVIDEQEVRALK